MDKVELRSQLRNRLLAMLPEQRKDKSRTACRHLIATEQFQNASIIMMYLSLPHEVDTSEAILHAWQLGKTIAVPKISWQQRHMIPVQITSLETGFATGAGGCATRWPVCRSPSGRSTWWWRPPWASIGSAIGWAEAARSTIGSLPIKKL